MDTLRGSGIVREKLVFSEGGWGRGEKGDVRI